jgi:hypothetical protein
MYSYVCTASICSDCPVGISHGKEKSFEKTGLFYDFTNSKVRYCGQRNRRRGRGSFTVLSWNVGGTLRQKRLLRALFPAETPRRERLEDVTHAIGFWPGVDRGCVCKITRATASNITLEFLHRDCFM